MPTLSLILGDQLNPKHPWFERVNDEVTYALYETWSEATYTRHHIQKVCAFFIAMRSFAEELRTAGHRVIYRTLEETKTLQLESITDNLLHDAQKLEADKVRYQLPDEYRLDEELKRLSENFEGVIEVVDTNHFLSTRDDLAELFVGKKTYLMETFYRMMRKRHRVMMEDNGEVPLSGKWNYDHDNRGNLPKDITFPKAITFPKDVTAIVEMTTSSLIQPHTPNAMRPYLTLSKTDYRYLAPTKTP